MEVIRHLDDLETLEKSVVTIGNFDGVHLGHRGVLGKAVSRAAEIGGKAVALTFVPHPVRVIAPGREPARLTPLERKLELMAESHVDIAMVLPFDRQLASMEAREFVEKVLIAGAAARVVIVGSDFRFGRGRAGNIQLLQKLGPELGFSMEPFEPVLIEGEPVSSTRIRGVLNKGRVELAARLLGRPHDVAGVVVRGDQRGRLLGFPTANLGGLRALLPALGVYACWAHFGGSRRMAAVNIGDRATFNRGRSVEAYLLDFEGDLYGRELQLSFVSRLRADAKFESVEALVTQISADVDATRRVLSHENAS